MTKEKGEVKTNGALFSIEDVTEILFTQPANSSLDVFQAAFCVPSSDLYSGLAVRLKLENWGVLKYVAIGYDADGKYTHVKIPHLRQGKWLDFSISHSDLAFLLQNGWKAEPPKDFSSVKVFIKGVPEKETQGILSISHISVWLEERVSQDVYTNCKQNNELLGLLESYWFKCFPEYDVKVNEWLVSGRFPSAGSSLAWPKHAEKPVTESSNVTLRYMWHALTAVSMLLLSAGRDRNVSSLFSAREMVALWLSQSYFKRDKDQKYAWYDHGTAERTIVLVGLWEYGLKLEFDCRFMGQLQDAILQHGRLLASESFYASHQSSRYHNHAWFQDVALLAISVAFSGVQECEEWAGIATERLTDQLNHLVVRDSGYAVFIENSIGYHRGAERLVTLAGKLAKLVGASEELSDIAKEFRHWSEEFIYPDERLPAQGDTFRTPNPLAVAEVVGKAQWKPKVIWLPKAGYMVAKGGNKNFPWMLSVVGSNLNSTHKHEDDMSLTLWFDGVEWLIDPSFYSHDYREELPAFLRSAYAHNALCFPESSYNIEPIKDRVELKTEKNDKGGIFFKGVNRSYSGVEIKRSIDIDRIEELPAFSVEDCVVFNHSEYVKEVSVSNACLVFHFGDGVDVKEVNSGVLELSHPASSHQLILSCQDQGFEALTVVNSVSGLGFTETVRTIMIRIPLDSNGKRKWSLNVK